MVFYFFYYSLVEGSFFMTHKLFQVSDIEKINRHKWCQEIVQIAILTDVNHFCERLQRNIHDNETVRVMGKAASTLITSKNTNVWLSYYS